MNLLLLPLLGVVGAGIASLVAYAALAAALIGWGPRLGGLGVREALLFRREDLESFRRLALALGRRLAMRRRPPASPDAAG